MSKLFQREDLNNKELFELPKKDEMTFRFLSRKRSLAVSNELQPSQNALKVKIANKKSKIVSTSLMKTILIKSQKAFEVIKSEERENPQNVHSLTPTSNKMGYNAEEKKEIFLPHYNNNKINKEQEDSIKKNLNSMFNSVSFKQKSLFEYFKK